ncbi:MAG: cardiolipin synthase [Bacteroidales bacterium]|nr:cardiolipin synthase [Bacteroidales bacterium]
MNEFWNILVSGWRILLVVLIFISIVIIIVQRRDPIKTIAWISVILLIPLAGLILFFFFGRSYRKKKVFFRKELSDFRQVEKHLLWQNKHLIHNLLQNDPELISKIGAVKLLFNNSKAILTMHNKIDILQNGDETFPAIFDAITQAKHHIHIESYIIEEGKVFQQLKELLVKKANEGIEVRVLYDDVGSWGLSKKVIHELTKAGIEVYAFLPVRFPRLAQRINYRNHRKIIVVDGKIGFIGGLNIADRYWYGSPDIGIWRDTHLKIIGTAVHSLQLIFLTDWHFATDRLLSQDIYFPENKPRNRNIVQIIASGPDSDWNSIMQAYFYLISTARKYVYMSTPYFIPNESILTAIKTIALSGVDVRIILPHRSDSKLTYYGSLSYLPELLEANVSVYTYKKGFTHSKVLIVDDIISSVGTANMDLRSFDQNFEVNALIYDKEITLKLKQTYLDDLKHCDKVILEEYYNKPFTHHFAQGIARIFSPIL